MVEGVGGVELFYYSYAQITHAFVCGGGIYYSEEAFLVFFAMVEEFECQT